MKSPWREFWAIAKVMPSGSVSYMLVTSERAARTLQELEGFLPCAITFDAKGRQFIALSTQAPATVERKRRAQRSSRAKAA